MIPHSRRGVTIKTAAFLAVFTMAGNASAGTQTFTPVVGGSPAYREQPALLNGKKVTLVRVTLYFHQMDLPPGSAQPIGLELFKYFLKDASGNIGHCEQWIKKVQTDEAAWTKQHQTFPYLEINTAENAVPLKINGRTIYRGEDVLCWEAMDFGPPVY
jgi:hypothetical protein